MKFAVVIHSDS